MTNISERSQWAENIYMIARGDRVEGGKEGVANIQAGQLAARTQHLKNMIEGASDYNEHTFYKTEDDPEGTIKGIAATPIGKLFRVAQGPAGPHAFIYYINDAGRAKAVAVSVGQGSVSNNIREYASIAEAKADVDAGNILQDARCFVRDDSQLQIDEYENDGGTLVKTGWRRAVTPDSIRSMPGLSLGKSGWMLARISDDNYLIYGVRSDNGYFSVRGLEIGDAKLSESQLQNLVGRRAGAGEYEKSGLVSAALSSDLRGISCATLDGTIDIRGVETLRGGYEKSGLQAAKLSDDYFSIDNSISQIEPRYQPYIRQEGEMRCLFAWDSVNEQEVQVTYAMDGNADALSIGVEKSFFTLDNHDDAPGRAFTFDHVTCEYHSRFTRLRKIAIWGHSFTSSAEMPSRLNQLLGDAWKVYTFGRGGAKSSGIARRQGAIETRRKLSVTAIPSDMSDFNLFPNFPGQHAMVNQLSTDNGHAMIEGVPCFVEWNAAGASSISEIRYHARRLEPGAAVNVPEGETIPVVWMPKTTVETKSAGGVTLVPAGTLVRQHAECINILWIGRNSLPNQRQIMADLQAVISKIERATENPKIVLMPEFPTSAETRGTPGWAQVNSVNRAYKKLYPEYYCEIDGTDALQNFKNHLNPALAGDLKDVENDITPRSLRDDDLHPSTSLRDGALYIGAHVNAEFIYRFLKMKGWA